MRRGALVAFGATCLVLGGVLGARLAPSRDVETARAEATVGGPRRVTLGASLERVAGIRTERAARRPIANGVELFGSIDFDPDRVADVGSRMGGRVERLFVELGTRVEVGDPLAIVSGPDLGAAVGDYLGARARLAAARVNAERERRLQRETLTTGPAVESAVALADALAAEVRGAEQGLRAIGLGDAEIAALSRPGGHLSGITLRAPIAGEVVDRPAFLGQVVEPTATLLRVADLSSLWAQLDVFERDIAHVHVGDPAEVRAEAFPGRVLHGVVAHVEARIDEATRTARVRVEIPNADRALRPGEFVTARLAPAGETRDAIVLPRSALLPIDGEPTVFVRTGAHVYEARTVAVRELGVDEIELVGGVAAGEDVVVEGGFALKSALLR